MVFDQHLAAFNGSADKAAEQLTHILKVKLAMSECDGFIAGEGFEIVGDIPKDIFGLMRSKILQAMGHYGLDAALNTAKPELVNYEVIHHGNLALYYVEPKPGSKHYKASTIITLRIPGKRVVKSTSKEKKK